MRAFSEDCWLDAGGLPLVWLEGVRPLDSVGALSQLPSDEGVPHLIRVARTHRSREVRRQAMFWLGQSGDPRALVFFEEVLRR